MKAVDAAQGTDDRNAVRFRQPKVQDNQVDGFVPANAREEFRPGADRRGGVARRLERDPETVTNKRGVVGHDDCLRVGRDPSGPCTR